MQYQIDGLVQEGRNSSALAMELSLSCTDPLNYFTFQSILLDTMFFMTKQGIKYSLWPCGTIWWHNLGQHWLRQRFLAWCHKTITCTNVDLSSVRSCGSQLKAISQEIHKISILHMSLKNYKLKITATIPRSDSVNSLRTSDAYTCP